MIISFCMAHSIYLCVCVLYSYSHCVCVYDAVKICNIRKFQNKNLHIAIILLFIIDRFLFCSHGMYKNVYRLEHTCDLISFICTENVWNLIVMLKKVNISQKWFLNFIYLIWYTTYAHKQADTFIIIVFGSKSGTCVTVKLNLDIVVVICLANFLKHKSVTSIRIFLLLFLKDPQKGCLAKISFNATNIRLMFDAGKC